MRVKDIGVMVAADAWVTKRPARSRVAQEREGGAGMRGPQLGNQGGADTKMEAEKHNFMEGGKRNYLVRGQQLQVLEGFSMKVIYKLLM